MDENEPKEQSLSSGSPPKKSSITLQQAIDFGEYDPKFLANFTEWHALSIHIHEACKSVEKQLADLQRDRERLYTDYSNKMSA